MGSWLWYRLILLIFSDGRTSSSPLPWSSRSSWTRPPSPTHWSPKPSRQPPRQVFLFSLLITPFQPEWTVCWPLYSMENSRINQNVEESFYGSSNQSHSVCIWINCLLLLLILKRWLRGRTALLTEEPVICHNSIWMGNVKWRKSIKFNRLLWKTYSIAITLGQ